MNFTVFGWTIVVFLDVLFAYLFWKYSRKVFKLKSDLIASFFLLISANVFLMILIFVVDTSECTGKPFIACVLNSNRGVWTFGALCIAAATLYFNARMKEMDVRSEEENRRKTAEKILISSSEEIVHNLQHFSYQIDDECEVLSFPATSFESTFELKESILAAYISRSVVAHVENLRRVTNHNLATIKALREIDPKIRFSTLMDDIGVLTFSRDKWLKWFADRSGENFEKRLSEAYEKKENPEISNGICFDKRIIAHSVRILATIAADYPAILARITEDRRLNWLSLASNDINKQDGMWFTYSTSEITDRESADIRSRKCRVYCWIEDRPVEGAETVSIRAEFRDLYHKTH